MSVDKETVAKIAHLARIRIGPVQAPELKPGRWRKLTPAEVELLLNFKQRDPETARDGSVGRTRRSRRATRTAR